MSGTYLNCKISLSQAFHQQLIIPQEQQLIKDYCIDTTHESTHLEKNLKRTELGTWLPASHTPNKSLHYYKYTADFCITYEVVPGFDA